MQGGVWFSAAIGQHKNAEARWLLPMICRRGGIDKRDLGAIRILDTSTEFEISSQSADDFAAKISRPDKDDNIRIEPLKDGPQRYVAPERTERTEQKPAYRGDAQRDNRGSDDKPRGAYPRQENSRRHWGKSPKNTNKKRKAGRATTAAHPKT